MTTAKALAVVSSTLEDVEKDAVDALWVRPVLVPLDGSALSERAIPWALLLAKRRHSPLLLVRIQEPWADMSSGMVMAGGFADPSELEMDLDPTGSTEYLAEQAAALYAKDPSLWIQTDVRFGPAADELLDAETRHHAQLVVMSTHSRSGAERWVRGSVAEKMLRHGAAPILLIRATDELSAFQGESGQGIKVLVPLDRSELAVGAVSEALRLVRTFEGSDPSIELFLALDERAIPHSGRRAESEDRSRTVAQRQSEAYLGQVAELLRGHHVRVEQTVIFSNDAAQAIIDRATQARVNAIVMCTHGRSAFGRWLHGSVADRVAHAATVPVMLYRPPASLQEGRAAQMPRAS